MTKSITEPMIVKISKTNSYLKPKNTTIRLILNLKTIILYLSRLFHA